MCIYDFFRLLEEEERKRREMTEQKEKKLKEEDLRLLEESKKKREEVQRKQIQEALNQQTYPQFKAYAEQHHPNNTQAVTRANPLNSTPHRN
jgi:predicted nucleotidyltransferase component of viral defense system